MKKVIVETFSSPPRCPTCGVFMWIPDDERVFTCSRQDRHKNILSCSNKTKYKIPTIELEEVE